MVGKWEYNSPIVEKKKKTKQNKILKFGCRILQNMIPWDQNSTLKYHF